MTPWQFWLRPWALATSLAFAVGLSCAYAQVPPGTFKIKAGKTSVDVASWGEHCGEKPKDGNLEPGSLYTLTNLKVLEPVGGSPPLFQTGICRAATSLPKLIEGKTRNGYNCKSPITHANQVQGRISWTLEPPNDIQIKHRFSYEWRLRGSHCKLTSVTKAHLQRFGEAPVAPQPAAACEQAGAPAEIRIQGRKKRRLRRSRTATLEATVVDAQGCPTGDEVTWSVDRGTFEPPKKLDLNGLKVGETATAEARFGDLTAVVKLRVASPSGEDALIIPPPSVPTAEKKTATAKVPISGWTVLGLEISQPKGPSPQWIGAGLALMIAGMLVQFRRRRK